MVVDPVPNLINDELLYCLPLSFRRQNPSPDLAHMCTLSSATTVSIRCLEDSKVGLRKVSSDLEHALLQEFEWITEHAEYKSLSSAGYSTSY